MDVGLWDRLIEGLWRTADDETAWPSLLAEIAAGLDCTKAALLAIDPRSGRPSFVQAGGFPVEQQHVYGAEFVGLDPWTEAAIERRLKVGTVIATHELVDDGTLQASGFAARALIPFGDFYGCAAIVHANVDGIYVLLILRGADRGPCGERELSLCRSLLPAFGGAVRVALRLGTLGNRHAALADLTDRLPYGIVTVSADGQVIEVNEMAERLLRRGDALTLRHGRLRTRKVGDLRNLRHLIATAARSGATFAGGGTLPIRRDGGSDLTILVAPIRRGQARLSGRSPAATVLIHDPQQVVARNVAAMTALFGLSRAEGRVLLALTEGQSPKDMARVFGVSVYTVRTQIRALQRKVGSKRASDLIRLTMTLPGLGEAETASRTSDFC